jgi:hypothetical protein
VIGASDTAQTQLQAVEAQLQASTAQLRDLAAPHEMRVREARQALGEAERELAGACAPLQAEVRELRARAARLGALIDTKQGVAIVHELGLQAGVGAHDRRGDLVSWQLDAARMPSPLCPGMRLRRERRLLRPDRWSGSMVFGLHLDRYRHLDSRGASADEALTQLVEMAERELASSARALEVS